MIIVASKFSVCTVIILYFGKRVARYGDAITEKTGLGGFGGSKASEKTALGLGYVCYDPDRTGNYMNFIIGNG